MPDPVVEFGDVTSAEQHGPRRPVGVALLVVLESLDPAERLAYVLHDMFAVPFNDIAPMLERTPAATRQLASRARRHVQGATPAERPDRVRQREIVEAWLAAARGGDFAGLVAMLHPNAVLRVDSGGADSKLVRGAAAIAGQAMRYRATAAFLAHFATVNNGPGIIGTVDGRVTSVLAFTLADGLIAQVDILTDPGRLAALNLSPEATS